MNPQFSTGNIQVPPLLAHLIAIALAGASFYLSTPTVVAHFPPWAQDAVPPTLAFLTWLGVTQVQAKQPEVKP